MLSVQIQILRLSAGDAALLDRVAEDVFDEPIRPDWLAAYLAQPSHLMVVALAEREVVGQVAAVIHRHPDKPADLYIDEVGVTPRLWRRGIARRMMDEMFAWGREVGCDEAWVATETDNEAAIGLYRGYGEEPETVVMFAYDL
jgi:ribosomal protein S18 acetylase RimI-like enzyme